MVSVIIPTLNAGKALKGLIDALNSQTAPPGEIIVIDSSSVDDTLDVAEKAGAVTITIPREDFDHGGTRNLAAAQARGDVLVFMTQDALPADEHMIESLTKPLGEDRVAASYARQLPRADATPVEEFARQFNYPPAPVLKGIEDVPAMGIKAFFMSNACSSCRASAFKEAGSFPEKIIMSEDMILGARLLRMGYRIAYAAEAKVYHSHNYSLMAQMRRYFDIGVNLRDNSALLVGAKAASEGLRFITESVLYLLGRGKLRWLPYALAEAILRYAGYKLGMNYRWLPRPVVLAMSMHREYFKKKI